MPAHAGICLHPRLILIGRSAGADVVAHEQEHAAQQRRDSWLRWVWRYFTSRNSRLAYEADAYAASARVSPWALPEYARALAGSLYRLSLTEQQAYDLIADRVLSATT
jgi:hypothetical protein